ncbi:hypothetical protein BCR37DRAFT_384519 [Protomyces lactucae-debilis]|uniref:Alpha/Beta hydrolase protein n=1 Tax=Protomyces lactucae-debilis TaxID=2754530 RepID=A0A1Y2ESX8_PROLT|nr:uncharacterized protein BCR37DRAFT_384519 [Protomyces lactucae-debilis]ORY74384.1 hypothetical protein BCR37DRAFT_384519 [Protomyces lactucae-debilis]
MVSATKARLHCCGLSHHDHTHPAGLDLDLAGTLCYGTGDNMTSAVLLLPGTSSATSWQDTHIRLLADKIARGANVTVLVPCVSPDAQSHAKRKHDTAEDPSSSCPPFNEASVNTLATHLRDAMSVTHVAVVGLFGNGAEVACACASAEEAEKLFKCAILALDTSHVPASLKLPTVLFQLKATSRQVIVEEPVAIRHTPLDAKAALFRSGSGTLYETAMRELLFWCKKHLHEWS